MTNLSTAYEAKEKELDAIAASVSNSTETNDAIAQQVSQESSAFITQTTERIDKHIADCDDLIAKTVNDRLIEVTVNTSKTLLNMYGSYYDNVIDVLASYAMEDATAEKREEIKKIYDDYVVQRQNFYGSLEQGKIAETVKAGEDAEKEALITTLIAQVTPETVRNTNILGRIVGASENLTKGQKANLSKQTASELDALVAVWNTIQSIDTLATKANGDYSLFTKIQENYAKLDDAHKALVYNFDLNQLYAQYFFLDFTPVSGGLSVKARDGYADKLVGAVVIPETYDGQKVVEIPERAFKNCKNITSLTIPNTVQSIGYAAFNGCSGLTSISLPFAGRYQDSGNYGERLFGYVFGSDAYYGGSRVDFGTFNSSRYDQGYDKDGHTYYIPIYLASVTLTNASKLSYHAFFNCAMIKELTINKELIILGIGVFANCTGITTIDLPSVETIPTSAFEGCTSLVEFTINPYVTTIGDYAFKGCKNLMRMNSDTDGTFVIPSNVTTIGYEAFNGVSNMKDLTIPHIGKYRNGGNFGERLFGIIFGPSLYYGGTKVDFGTFNSSRYDQGYDKDGHTYCIPSKMKSVTVTNASSVSYHAFMNCSMLSSIRINKEAMVDVGGDAFKGSVSPT
jgi:hypothetical protein